MYENIGQKIKGLTTVIVVIMMGLSVIGGIMVAAIDEDMVISGLLIAGIGCFAAWISGMTMYAYGDMADNLQSINYQLAKSNGGNNTERDQNQFYQPVYQNPVVCNPVRQNPMAYDSVPQNSVEHYEAKVEETKTPATSIVYSSWFCSHCGTENSTNHSQCKKCGKYKT